MNPNPSGQPATPASSPTPQSPRLVPLAISSGLLVCIAGGFVTGFMLTQHAVFGVILMGVGWLAGIVSRTITGTASRVVGQCLVASCVLAFALSMVSWYRWGLTLPDETDPGKRRDPTWAEAVVRAPQILLQGQAPVTLLVSGICAAFGATEAYRKAARTYRLVEIAEE